MIHDLVSTVIPVFNRPEMLRRSVESVLNQDYRPIEIIICDDGSTDDTPLVAQQLIDANRDIVRYVRQHNAGPGPARERGRLQAKGEFIQYLDSDDLLLPNKFSDQVRILRQHPECDVAYGITRLVGADGGVLADPFKWTDREIPQLYPGLLVDRWWCTHTPLYRRSLTDKIGAWSDMRWSQDWEYDSRVGGLKTKIVSTKTHVSEHCHHDGIRQTSAADWTSDRARLLNRVRLLTVLWKGAVAAEVDESSPQRQHFARWCFSIARCCAGQGMKQETGECLRLAEAAAGPAGPGRRGIRVFRVLMRCLGGENANRIIALASRRGSSGTSTLPQSFSGQVEG